VVPGEALAAALTSIAAQNQELDRDLQSTELLT
jgi:hypothetical protein